MPTRTEPTRAGALVLAMVFIVSGASWTGTNLPVGAEDSRTVSVSKTSGLTDGAVVTVSWSGFTPGAAYLMQCSADAISGSGYSSCPERTRLSATTGPDGTGSAEFRVWAGIVDGLQGEPGANDGIYCDGPSCAVVVTACGFFVDAAHSAEQVIDVTAPPPPPDDDGDGEPDYPNSTTTTTTTTTTTRPPPVAAAPDAVPLRGTGSSAAKPAVEAWQDAVGPAPRRVAVDYTATNSPSGLNEIVRGDDFAISSLPLSSTQAALLRDAGAEIGYAPVLTGTMVIAYQWSITRIPVDDLRLSPKTIAKIYKGQATSMADPAIVSDNRGCRTPFRGVRYRPVPVYRADASGANQLFTTWLDAMAPSVWDRGAGPFFNLDDSQQTGRLGSEEVAKYIASTNPGEVRMGYVDLSYAKAYDLQIAAIENGSGNFVKPTEISVAAALRAARVSNGFLTADVATTDPAAYPLTSVYYLLAQTRLTETYSLAAGRASKTFLDYATSAEGQAQARELGFWPLPEDLLVQSRSLRDRIPTTVIAAAPAGSAGASPPVTTPTGVGKAAVVAVKPSEPEAVLASAPATAVEGAAGPDAPADTTVAGTGPAPGLASHLEVALALAPAVRRPVATPGPAAPPPAAPAAGQSARLVSQPAVLGSPDFVPKLQLLVLAGLVALIAATLLRMAAARR